MVGSFREKGRGALTNRSSRFSKWQKEALAEEGLEKEADFHRTQVLVDSARAVLSWNSSPDIPFDRSINPFKGCEHGCPYCYARPTHAYLGLSPGLDFESKIAIKPEAAKLLVAELSKPGYQAAPLALGSNTDPYQPLERRFRITRRLLEVLSEFNHPVVIVTKSALIERDLAILAAMAERRLVQVFLSVTTLNPRLARRLEPRAAAPRRRIETIRALAAGGIPVGVLFAPVIPGLNDSELESVLQASRLAGAEGADYVMLRLPREVKGLFVEWLEHHFPLRAQHILHLIREVRQGQENSSDYGIRMRGVGPYADMIAQRFRLSSRRLGLDKGLPSLDCSQFRSPQAKRPQQMRLFD